MMSDGQTLIMALCRAGELEAVLAVQQALPGGVLTIPLSADTPSRARDLMGENALRLAMAEGLAGRDVEILDGPEAATIIRLGMTAEYMAAGKSTAWIAQKIGATEREVLAIKRQLREAAE